MDRDDNPYAAPKSSLRDATKPLDPQAEAEKIRRQFLGHEASIKSVGFLCHVGGGILVTAVLGINYLIWSESGRPWIKLGPSVVVILLIGGLAALMFWLGAGLRGLNRRVILPMAIFSGLTLLAFPIGTFFGLYVLSLLYTKSGKMVFSDEYKLIIARTPHIQYHTTILLPT